MLKWTSLRMTLIGLCLSAVLPAAAAPPPVELTLHEPLDRDWEPQWVSWTVEPPAGQFREREVLVRDSNGADTNHAIDVQATFPDGSIKKAVVWVYTALTAGQTKQFRLCQVGPMQTADVFRDARDLTPLGYDNGMAVVQAWIGAKDFDPPVPANTVLPPIRSACRAAAHPETLSTRLAGLPPVRRMSSHVETPAHRLRHELRYEFADASQYVFCYTMIRNEPVLVIEEDFRGLTGGALVVDFSTQAGFTHAHGRGRLHPPSTKGELESGYEIDLSREWTGRVQPFYAWWPDYGLWWAAYTPGGEYVGILPLNPPAWTNPAPNPLQVRTRPGGQVEVFCPLERGTRRWAIVLADANEALRVSQGGANLMMKLAIRLGQNPLDQVKDMVLAWPGMDDIQNPRLLCRAADIPGIREKARTHPLYKQVLEQSPDKPNDPAGLYLATGDERHARQAIDGLTKQLRAWVAAALDGTGYAEALCAIGFTRPLRQAAITYDLVAASPSMTAAERNYCLRAFAFLMYCLADEDRWPARYQGFARGNVNFHSDDYTCRAAVACLLAGHPLQRQWMSFVEHEMGHEFASSVYPGGAWCEAPNYQGFTMHYLMIAMRVMQLNGFADFAKDPRFRATMDYFFRIQTPYDVRARQHLLPTVGDTTSYYHSQSLANVFAWAARLFAQDDPELAGRMMHAWKRCGSIAFGTHGLGPGAGWVQPLLMIDPDIPDRPPSKPLQSERLPGYGALLRNNYGTDHESYFLFKMGPADQHYDSDEGSFHWYALGAPLSLDFGSMYKPSIEQPWLHSTLDFDRQRTWSRGEVTTFISLPALDFCVGELAVNDLQHVPDLPDQTLPPGTSDLIRRGHNFLAWRRSVLFVKGPDYLVLRDDLDDIKDNLPTGWSVQVLASQVDLSARRATFTGQHGVDLAVLLAEPSAAKPTTSQWGHPGEVGPDWVPGGPMPAIGETQIALHATAPPDGDYMAALVPYHHGGAAPILEALGEAAIRVRHEQGEDLVLFGGDAQVLQAQDVTFAGRVGVVRRTAEGCVLHIVDGVSMRVPEMIAQFPGPVTLEVRKGHLRGVCDGQVRTCFLHWMKDIPPIPASLTIDAEPQYAYSTFDGYLSFTVPAGQHVFEVRYDSQEE